MSSNVRQGSKNDSGESDPSSGIAHRKEAGPIIIDDRNDIYSVAILADGKHVVSGGREEKIQRWRIEDGNIGKRVGAPMKARSHVLNIAVSRDGKVIVSGTKSGWVAVWNSEGRSKVPVIKFKAHNNWVGAVDVSSDGTKITTGSDDCTACVWSLSTGKRLLGPLQHNYFVVAAKFSPDGRFIATATQYNSVRVYDSQNGSPLVVFPVEVSSALNHSLAWASDSKQLFALSRDGYIYHVDVSTRIMLSKWIIHSSNNPTCIALADNGTFIAAAAGSLLSFWDTTRRAQIGTVIEYTHGVWSMVISSNNHLVTSGHKKITLRALRDILPPHYLDNTPRMQEIQHKEVQKVGDGPNGRTANFENTVRELRNQLAKPQQTNQERDIPIQSLRAQEESSNSKITRLEKTVRERARSPRAASQEKDRLKETAHSLRGNLYTRDESSSGPITHPEQTIQELRVQLADTQRKADGLIRISHAYEQKHQYESLYAQGRIQGAAECLLEILNTVNEDVRGNKFIMDWLTELTPRCITALERVGDEASTAGKRDEAVAAYSTALSLGPSTPNTIMIKWVSMILKNGSAHEALSAATKFKVPRVVVYSAICDILARDGRLTEVVECFRQLLDELPQCGSIQSCHACTTACRPTQTFCDG